MIIGVGIDVVDIERFGESLSRTRLSPSGRLRIDTLAALLRIPRGDVRGAHASLIRALGRALQLGFDPLDCYLGEAWQGHANMGVLDLDRPSRAPLWSPHRFAWEEPPEWPRSSHSMKRHVAVSSGA